MRFLVLFTFLMCLPLGAALIPMPREIQYGVGELLVDVRTAVIAPDDLAVPAGVLTVALQKTTGRPHFFHSPQKFRGTTIKGSVSLAIVKMEKKESYRLEITPMGVTINGSDLAGVMHGVQAFVQLLPVAEEPILRAMVPSQTIKDWPETRRRIFHLDVSQHLFPTADLKGFIDWLVFHKLNELHLQLNGDAGWRMESLAFPKLHEVGSVRASTPPSGDPTGSDSTEYGGYYSQENLREIAEYAKARGIEVVPCFSFVTGASALIAAYPEMGAAPAKVATTWEDRKVGILQNEDSLKFLEDFFAEVMTVFPSKFVRLQGEGGEFHEQLKAVLKKHKKELFLAGEMPSTNFSVYSRPAESELLLSDKLIAEEGFNSLRQVYDLKAGDPSEASLRTRYVPDMGKLQYLVFPRIAAFAEATWLPVDQRKYDDFRTRATDLVSYYRLMKVASALPYEPPTGGAIGGTIVTSSLTGRDLHGPDLIFDGRGDSFFWSERGLKKGDHLTVEFPWPIEGDLSISTGRWGGLEEGAPGMLVDGVLDLSADGKEWDAVTEFFDGLASVTVPSGTKFARVRVFTAQDDPLVLHEVSLSEPLLLPESIETREVRLPASDKVVTLTFKADFEGHPEFRDEISILRRTFFKEWLPLSVRLGLAHDMNTPRIFEVKSGEPGELSAEEAREWLLKRLISRIQDYPVTAPLWFATGMEAMLMDDLPEKPDRSKNLEGGPQTAVFLRWVAQKYGEQVLMTVSQDCRAGRHDPSIWKVLTRKSLEELREQFQEDS